MSGFTIASFTPERVEAGDTITIQLDFGGSQPAYGQDDVVVNLNGEDRIKVLSVDPVSDRIVGRIPEGAKSGEIEVVLYVGGTEVRAESGSLLTVIDDGDFGDHAKIYSFTPRRLELRQGTTARITLSGTRLDQIKSVRLRSGTGQSYFLSKSKLHGIGEGEQLRFNFPITMVPRHGESNRFRISATLDDDTQISAPGYLTVDRAMLEVAPSGETEATAAADAPTSTQQQ